jgi:hypothetical protein
MYDRELKAKKMEQMKKKQKKFVRTNRIGRSNKARAKRQEDETRAELKKEYMIEN